MTRRNPIPACSRKLLALAVTLGCVSLEAALARGDASGSFYLRYEGVDEDNALKNAGALTLRSALKYTTATVDDLGSEFNLQWVRPIRNNY